jgi:hypothetical protein
MFQALRDGFLFAVFCFWFLVFGKKQVGAVRAPPLRFELYQAVEKLPIPSICHSERSEESSHINKF